jgi:hypothetical protein
VKFFLIKTYSLWALRLPVKTVTKSDIATEKIEISVGDVKISLPDDFSEDTLRRLLGVLK